MAVILTSFRQSDIILHNRPDVTTYSVARFQPKGYFYENLYFLAAFDKHGKRLFLRDRENPLEEYMFDWWEFLDTQKVRVNKWLQSLDANIDILLACWCPHSDSTRNQLKKYGAFACHTGLIGQVINHQRPDIQVYMDEDRHNHLVKEWKPFKYRVI